MIGTMIIAAIVLVTTAALSWLTVRRCPLARAIGLQIRQAAESR